MATNLNRTMIQLNDEMKSWVEEQAKDYGMSMSAFINLCIKNFKMQQESIKAMNNISPIMAELQKIQVGIEQYNSRKEDGGNDN